MKPFLLTIIIILLSTLYCSSQLITQRYTDPCDGMEYTITFPLSGQGVYIIVRNQIKLFTYQQFQSGEVDVWIKSIFSTPCTLPQTTLSQSLQGSISQSISGTTTNISAGDANSTTNNTENGGESKSKSGGSKKSKDGVGNPTIISSDLTVSQSSNWNTILNIGVSRSSLVGDESYSANMMVWSNLKQYALTTGYSKSIISSGKQIGTNLFSNVMILTNGKIITIPNYTRLYNNKKYGTYGFNFGLILNKIDSKMNYASSLLFFWSNSYKYNKKLTLNPQVFVNSPGITYLVGTSPYDINIKTGIIPGISVDYKISKRFGFLLTYRGIVNIDSGVQLYNNFLLGSKMML